MSELVVPMQVLYAAFDKGETPVLRGKLIALTKGSPTEQTVPHGLILGQTNFGKTNFEETNFGGIIWGTVGEPLLWCKGSLC